ncbi:tRNA-guanine transglycosylase DpdA [Candidatus Riflebacteria bacterium]
MKFFFPDSSDLIDPGFNFESENRDESRIRQRTDKYAHEIFSPPPYDGILVSKTIVEGIDGKTGKFSMAQKQRILREGAQEFYRTKNTKLETMGDCGAISYIKKKKPPFSVDEVIEFYLNCRFDFAISPDHIITNFTPHWDAIKESSIPIQIRERQEITIELAEEFFQKSIKKKANYIPIGVAQGWSPNSYAKSVMALQKIGFKYIALGGLISLTTRGIISCLKNIYRILAPDVNLHLLGISRFNDVNEFSKFGVTSLDSTSPFRQSFKGGKNYHTPSGKYIAIRVPQIQGNALLAKQIQAGLVEQDMAVKREELCLRSLREFDAKNITLENVLSTISEYERIHFPNIKRNVAYQKVLKARPWEKCPCPICQKLKINVVIMRGIDRNKSRGFHNLFVFSQELKKKIQTKTKNNKEDVMKKKTYKINLPGLEIKQGKKVLYSFAIDGKILPKIAAISRIHRDDSDKLKGYQRPEVITHIQNIREYVESTNPLLPNSLVVAFDKRISFKPLQGKNTTLPSFSKLGTISIPINESWTNKEKPGWIVDGQQRTAAIRDADISDFPVPVVAFIASDEKIQREQFILVNSSKPLPKGLIYELLPGTKMKLPCLLEKRRYPAKIMQKLNFENESPLKGMINMPTNPSGVIKDNSILKFIENSLSDGVLYRFRDIGLEDERESAILSLLYSFWEAVSVVFTDAWGLPPKKSRLMHGAGIISLGFLMDAISDRHRAQGLPTSKQFEEDLKPLKTVCRWTDGFWDLGPGQKRKWNEIQNTCKDIQILSNYLFYQYKLLVWNPGVQESLSNH